MKDDDEYMAYPSSYPTTASLTPLMYNSITLSLSITSLLQSEQTLRGVFPF